MKEKVIKFTNMKVKDLKVYLKENGIKGYSKLKKAELQDMVYDIMFGTEPEKPTKEEEATLKLIKPETAQEEIWYNELLNCRTASKIVDSSGETHTAYFKIEADTLEEFNTKYEEIKTKYRKMRAYFHPDRIETGDAVKFRVISKSFEYDEEQNNKDLKEELSKAQEEILQKKEEDKISEMTKKYKAVFRQVKLRDEYRWHLYIYDREVDDIDGKNLILDEEIYWDTRVQPDGTYKVNIDNFKYRLNGLKEEGKITEGARRLAIKLAKKFNEMKIKKEARKTA